MDTSFKFSIENVKILTLSILCAFFIYPILITILVPILVHRIFVQYLAKKWNPKICKMISGLSAVLVGKNPYSKPEFVLVAAFPLKSKVDRSQVVKVINNNLLKYNQFPELSQRIVSKLGYNFWCQTDKKISAEDHVRFLNSKCPEMPMTRNSAIQYVSRNLVRQPFPSDRSPWEIILVPNVFDESDSTNRSLAILRFHHCLMDGYSVVNFVKKCATKPWKQYKIFQRTNDFKTSKWNYLLQTLMMFITGPYLVIRQVLYSNDNSEFIKMIFSKQQKNKELSTFVGKEPLRIDMGRLKNVKTLHNVNVSSIIITLAMEAMAKFIRKRWGTVEKNMFLQMPHPISAHPGGMTNHWGMIRMPIRFHEKDPAKTLKMVSKEFDLNRNSVVPTLGFMMANLLGLFPDFLRPQLENITQQTGVLSNFPGPGGKENIFGYEYDDFVSLGAIPNGTAFGFLCVSMNGKLSITAGACPELIKTENDADEFNGYLENVLESLECGPNAKENEH